MKKKRIYLAGAIGCYPPGSREPIEWRVQVDKDIRHFYGEAFYAFNPMDYYQYGSDFHQSEREPMIYDLRAVENSDVILVNLKDINKSIGTSDEILTAYRRNIPVIGFLKTEEPLKNKEELYQYIHPWKVEQMDRVETGFDAMDKAIEYIADFYG